MVGGEQKRFGSGVFRMKPDGSALEFMHQFNNNTWGLGFNSSGDVFGSTANNNPSFFCGIPATAYRDGKKGMTAKMIATDRSFHPITPNIRQVDAFNNYTAGAGHAMATSAAFPESYREKVAFIGGPTGHLLGMYEMIPTQGHRICAMDSTTGSGVQLAIRPTAVWSAASKRGSALECSA